MGAYTIRRADFEPAYLALHCRGELQRRAEAAVATLAECRVCPRDCRVNRLADKTATCKTGRYAQVSSYFPHLGEEDCLRGWRGSGTIFFSRCNLRCVFCQNFDISQAQLCRCCYQSHTLPDKSYCYNNRIVIVDIVIGTIQK